MLKVPQMPFVTILYIKYYIYYGWAEYLVIKSGFLRLITDI